MARDNAKSVETSSAARLHYGKLSALPPYVGGDDDEIEEWKPECFCGWRGPTTKYVTSAHIELIRHLNEALRG